MAGCVGELRCAGGLVGGVHGAASGSAGMVAAAGLFAAAGLLSAGRLFTISSACILAKLEISVWTTEPSGHVATRKA